MRQSTPVTLVRFSPVHLPALVAFLNRALAGHRHWTPITPADFTERVLGQPAFDPQGLILAWAGERVVGGVHAIKPVPASPTHTAQTFRSDIAWLAVVQEWRGQGVGHRLLQAAADYLYDCPIHFAGQSTPFYGIAERLWVPWYGTTERMGVSAVNDTALVDWLGRRGYQAVHPGDVSMATTLHGRERPLNPGLAAHGLQLEPINERSPWTGDEPFYRLRGWGHNGGRPYQGLVMVGDGRAVGSVVWYPLPDNLTAALAWLGLERRYRGLRFGSYLLDRALVEMAHRGYLYGEVHVHTRDNPEAFAMFRRRGFQVIDYWVNLVRT